MNKFIFSKVLRTIPTDPVWWTPECSAAVEAKRKAWNLHRRNRDNVVLQEACNITRTATANCLTRTEALHMQQVRRKLSGSMRDREWWSTVKHAGGHGRQSTISVLVDKSGQEHTKSCDKADLLGQYFAEKCSLERDFDNCTPTLPNVRQRSPNAISTIYFRLSTLLRTLKHLHPCKATGPDGIPARVLKMGADTLAYPLSKLYTLCFRTGIQPAAWKVANIVPVFKKGSKSIPKNYRPISLLSIISKCMESIINRSISNFLERNAILSPTQFGFRAGLGIADLLLALHHEWSRNTNQGGLVRVLAVDIASAFDKVSHRGVLHKAAQYGIQGCLHNWLRCYLHNRKIRIVVGGQSFSTHTIKSGVPQDSILGPTVFLLYTNDAEDHIPPETQLAVYTDDTTLYNCIASREGTLQGTDVLQQAVDALADWGSAWRITFEPSKSQALVISHHRTSIALPPKAQLCLRSTGYCFSEYSSTGSSHSKHIFGVLLLHLPCYLLREAPSHQGLQTFKTKVYHHLRNTNWSWATQSL